MNVFFQKKIPIDIISMLFSTLFFRMAFFLVWPYLAIYLHHAFHINSSEIGIVLFFVIIIGYLFNLYLSHISDYIGRRIPLLISLLLSVFGSLIIIFSENIYLFIFSIILLSGSKEVFESCCKSLIGDCSPNLSLKSYFQYLRYFTANVGACIGSLIGLLFNYFNWPLKYPSFISYFLCLSVVFLGISNSLSNANSISKSNFGFLYSFVSAIKNRRFLNILIVNVLIIFIYSAFDMSLGIYLSQLNIHKVENTIAILALTNTVIVILFQLPINIFITKTKHLTAILVGIFLIGISQLLFSLIDPRQIYQLVAATIVLSLGELISMPSFVVELDNSIPHSSRGISFGIANLTTIGIAFSPLIGGYIIERFSGPFFFEIQAIFTIFLMLFYYLVVYRSDAKYHKLRTNNEI